jgi:hypothetical protein
MVMTLKTLHADGKKDTMVVVPTILGDARYLSMGSLGEDFTPESGWKEERLKEFVIFKYKLRDGKLLVYFPDGKAEKRLSKAVLDGDIRGKVEKGILEITKLTESTEGLRKFIAENESWMFTEKVELAKR